VACDEGSGDVIEASFNSACALHAQGDDEQAKRAYLEVLAQHSTHLGALTNLGTLLFNTGYRQAARTAYRRAVEHHPQSAMARVNLANALYENDQLYLAREHYEAAIETDASCAPAHQGLAYVLEKLGDVHGARRHRDLGYRDNAVTIVPYRGTQRPIPVLLLVSALGGNVNTDRFLDDRTFLVTKLFAEYYDPAAPVPFHSFVFNAIGDAELCPDALQAARAIVARTNAPVINPPAAVLATSRAENAKRFAGISGVIAPRTMAFDRAALAAGDAGTMLAREGFVFPLLLRTPGFHTGYYFVRVERETDLAAAIEELPGDRLTAIEFLDARGRDGNVRKYRVLIVDGQLYPVHLAVARQWKVHYYTAQTQTHPAHRAEEAAFLADMPAALGTRAAAALEAMASALALDYAGIDFGIDAEGNVLFFEANATMLVPSVEPGYRQVAQLLAQKAVTAMLDDRHRRSLP
jgi:glutathione synthase/RimK-type ligase-like ATP-grasp enzyme